MSEAVTAGTRYGQIRGTRRHGVCAFLGIPYGRSTAPPRRFLPPEAPQPWTGVCDALRFGPRAPQAIWRALANTRSPGAGIGPEVSLALEPHPENRPPISEDCLNLNVWTAGVGDGQRRPVMVYLHGGGFITGSSVSASTDGACLAATGEVVVVSVNHRLGILGYLALGGLLGPDYADSGVNGMLDLVAALAWVRDNIENFGGDPGRVLIFGESGGGAKVSTLLGMPTARGLFNRAAVHSDAGIRGLEPAEAEKLAADVLVGADLTADRADQLLTLPLEEILRAQTAVFAAEPANRDVVMRVRPVVGGPHLPAHPFDPVASAPGRDVPLVVGTNKDEVSLFVMADPEYDTMDLAGVAQRLMPALGDRTQEVLEMYRGKYPDLSPTVLYVRILSDRTVREPAMRLALRQASDAAAPVYAYLLTWETSALGGRLRSPHVLDIPLVFRNTDSPLVGDSDDRFAVSDRMSRAWIAFAATGSPNGPGLATWPPYTPGERRTMLFGAECSTVSDPAREELDLFREDPSIRRPW
jgi:para-nitrobenzyl esterase